MSSSGKASVFVYGLCAPDPHQLKVMYVGCTGQHLHHRLQGHINEALRDENLYSPKIEWIRSLLIENMEPVVVLLEQVRSGDDWQRREQHWIEFFGGHSKLLNLTKGGIGAQGLAMEVRERISRSNRGRKLSEEHRRAISEGNLGKTHTAEARKSISETRKRLIAEGALQMPSGGSAKAAEQLKGSVWVTNGEHSQRLPKGQPIPDGWRPGRK